ncbi:hypothetical protein [Pseudolabrys sp.]|uniref:hypothetical protein n=1 Tax=Pseudolabrys sp. TaxID=1960880 RepID=UPI003D146B3A
MSHVHMIAWGTLDEKSMSPEDWHTIKRLARDELAEHNMWIGGGSARNRHLGTFRLTKLRTYKQRSKRGKQKTFKQPAPHEYFTGNFQNCCKVALKIIEGRRDKNKSAE